MYINLQELFFHRFFAKGHVLSLQFSQSSKLFFGREKKGVNIRQMSLSRESY